MNTLNKIYLLAVLSFLAASCSEGLEKDIPLVKLGAGTKAFTVEVDGGTVNIPVYSNGGYHLEMVT